MNNSASVALRLGDQTYHLFYPHNGDGDYTGVQLWYLLANKQSEWWSSLEERLRVRVEW